MGGIELRGECDWIQSSGFSLLDFRLVILSFIYVFSFSSFAFSF